MFKRKPKPRPIHIAPVDDGPTLCGETNVDQEYKPAEHDHGCLPCLMALLADREDIANDLEAAHERLSGILDLATPPGCVVRPDDEVD